MQVNELLRWKHADYSRGRPASGRHREITSKRLQHVICGLYGCTVSVLGEQGVSSLTELVSEQHVGSFIEWSINVRKVKGQSLHVNLGSLCAAMNEHPAYKSLDLTWFRPLIDSVPVERESEIKRRKAEKYLEYDVVRSIPGKVRAERPAAAKKGKRIVALVVMQELLMKWFTVIPWRQRNVRECRIGGAAPNLFKGTIPPFSDIEKPEWVIEVERTNPGAEFWQFHFSPEETKTGLQVQALLPRQPIVLLDEYLNDFRNTC